METESLGKLVPQMLIPYAQEWAERSGLTLLSRLLVDEQFRSLIEKYSDELASRALSNMAQPRNGNNGSNGHSTTTGPVQPVSEAESTSEDLSSLQDRVFALEAQQEMQLAIFESLRTKIRPLALALGSCPECLVGVEGCLKCGGRARVGDYSPDYALLEAEVVRPLVARGVPLSLQVRKGPSTGRQSRKPTARKGA